MSDEEDRENIWRPNPGPQTAFLACGAFEVLYGGAAGGGKSDALIVDAIRNAFLPKYRALLFRRTVAELKKPSGLLERAWAMLPSLGAIPSEGGYTWRWPGGGRFDLAGMEHETDRFNFKSTELNWIGFDEATSFTGPMLTYMVSRLRGGASVKSRVRYGSNPGDIGHDFMLDRFGPWLRLDDPDYDGPRALPGERLFVRFDEQKRDHVFCQRTEPGAVSRTFFPAYYTDTPQLDQVQYSSALDQLDAFTREQLKNGNWLIRPSAGLMFRQAWFSRTREPPTIVSSCPKYVRMRVRAWDFAASPKKEGREGKPAGNAASAGVRMSLGDDGRIYVEHVERLWGTPGKVRATVKDCAIGDDDEFGSVLVDYPTDPGQAGIDQRMAYEAELTGLWNHSSPERGDKIDRAKPFSSACEHGQVVLVAGSWNTAYLRELEDFPFGLKDQVDASSRAYAALLRGAPLIKAGDRSRRVPTRETARARGNY